MFMKVLITIAHCLWKEGQFFSNPILQYIVSNSTSTKWTHKDGILVQISLIYESMIS